MNMNLNQFEPMFGPHIVAAVSEKKDGTMTSDAVGFGNRYDYFNKLQIPFHIDAWRTKLVHGAGVRTDQNPTLIEADALVTNDPDVCLTVLGADCPPVFLYDPVHEVRALLHCGWKSVVAGLIENTVRKMQDEYGTQARDLVSVIGPGIGPCHFEVGYEVAEELMPEHDWAIPGDACRVDLGDVIASHLFALGILLGGARSHFFRIPTCTYCQYDRHGNHKYFSHRRDKVFPIESQVAVFGIMPAKQRKAK